ncbi:MAG TPA: Phenylacetic acid catabolic protein [Anaerolineales bacterium]
MKANLGFRNVNDLDPGLAASLLNWALALADSKYFLGRRLSEWVNGAPTLEAAVGAAAMTQDELGHARSLYAMLREFPGAPGELGTETDLKRTDYFSPAALMKPWDSWTDVVAVNVLFDRALNLVFAATSESNFGPLNQRAPKVLQEEHFHRVYGDAWLARLADSDEKTQDQLRKALLRAWSLSDAWIGPSDDPVTTPLVAANVLAVSPERLRSDWTESGHSLLEKYNLNLEPPQIDWSRWDPKRREVVIDA